MYNRDRSVFSAEKNKPEISVIEDRVSIKINTSVFLFDIPPKMLYTKNTTKGDKTMDIELLKPLTTQEQRAIKDRFETKVDRRSRRAMIAFLTTHSRYHTMNSWNGSTSYAHCIKLTRLPLPNELDDTAWQMLEMPEWHAHMSDLLDVFAIVNDQNWQVGTNGRSGGYLVLYQGKREDNNRVVCYAGRSVDDNPSDFDEWDMDDLHARVEIVRDFDRLVADVVMDFGAFCRSFDIGTKTIDVPQEIKILIPKEERADA